MTGDAKTTSPCRHRSRALLGAAILAATLAGCADGEPRAPRAPDRVILITVDTLRADRVAEGRGTTPVLDALAAEGVRFERAYATSSWTVPSIASLHTSEPPASHGLVHGYVGKNGRVSEQSVLAPEHLTLAETLGEHGYATFGFTTNVHLDRPFGFDQGFDVYDHLRFASASEVNGAIAKRLDQIERSGRYFLWVHYFDPHAPYKARKPHFEEIFPEGANLDDDLLAKLQRLMLPEQLDALRLESHPQLLRVVEALYDSEVRETDRAIGELLEMLSPSEHDLVIVTSDHGEEFQDHEWVWHGHTLHEELIRVPLVARFPASWPQGLTVADPVSQLDLLPTLTEMLEADPSPRATGLSLLPLLRGESFPARALTAQTDKLWPLRSIIRWPYKYHDDIETPTSSMLFDLEADPAELTNILHEKPELARSLEKALENHVARHRSRRPERRTTEVARDTLEALRSVGYVD